MGKGLWEIRCKLDQKSARIFFIMVDQEIVLLHGFIKKSQTTPQKDLELARKRHSIYLATNQRQRKMKTEKIINPHRGDDFTSFLEEKNILPEVQALALKRVVAIQLQQIIDHDKVSKTELAKRMNTSRASLNRILDPSNSSATLNSIGKAAAAFGKKVEINFVNA